MQTIRIIANLWVKCVRFDEFEAFEAAAFKIIERHGGKILKRLKKHGSTGLAPHEVHKLEFPTKSAFESYRTDPELLAMSSMRDACIERTEIIIH